MATVFLQYLRWARDQGRTRNVLTSRLLQAADIAGTVQTAAVRLRLIARYSRVRREHPRSPASAAKQQRFFREAALEPLPKEALEEKTERFPLESTLSIDECASCHGTGRMTCVKCRGSGLILCQTCGAWGWDSRALCLRCHGRGAIPCSTCENGQVPHDLCDGEGRLGAWVEEIHTRWGRVFEVASDPREASSSDALSAIHSYFAKDRTPPLSEISRAAVVRRLGYDTPELSEILQAMERNHDLLERRARAESSDRVSIIPEIRVVPVGVCVLWLPGATEPVHYWRIGSDRQAVEIGPSIATGAWKIRKWAALPFLASVATGAFLQPALGTPLLGVGLTAMAAASVARTPAALAHRRPVRTVAIIHCAPRPILFLRLLVSLGAYVRAFEATGRGYRTQLDALMRESAPSQPWSVVVKLPSGGLLRLCELREPDQLSIEDRRALSEIAAGFVFLETPDTSADLIQPVWLAEMNGHPPCARLLLSPDADSCDAEGRAPNGGIATEELRRAFAHESNRSIDWNAACARLLAPILKLGGIDLDTPHTG